MPERPDAPEDNPFRADSPRKLLSRAREQLRLVRHWLIHHEEPPARDAKPRLNGKDPSAK